MHVPSDKLIQFTKGVHEKYVRAKANTNNQ